MVLRSEDQGRHRTYLPSGYKGSFRTGVAPAPGVLPAAGLRGCVYGSADDGATWTPVDSHVTSSITAAKTTRGELVLAGMDGVLLRSRDAGSRFAVEALPGRPDLTTVLSSKARGAIVLARTGVMHP